MPTPEKIQSEIDEINETLNSGVTSTSNGGVSASISHTALRRRRAELQAELDELKGESRPQSPFTPVQL